MAGRTGVAEIVGRMVRIGRPGKCRTVTAVTVARRVGIAAGMARYACCRGMRAGQGETRSRVIKRSRSPGGR
jgi:hypothetical protein